MKNVSERNTIVTEYVNDADEYTGKSKISVSRADRGVQV
jgi:hypothetical protein